MFNIFPVDGIPSITTVSSFLSIALLVHSQIALVDHRQRIEFSGSSENRKTKRRKSSGATRSYSFFQALDSRSSLMLSWIMLVFQQHFTGSSPIQQIFTISTILNHSQHPFKLRPLLELLQLKQFHRIQNPIISTLPTFPVKCPLGSPSSCTEATRTSYACALTTCLLDD